MDLVTTHRNTDFDALASVVAATLLYDGAVAALPKSLNPNVKAFLSIHKDVFRTQRLINVDMAAVERLVVVDTNRWERLEKGADLRKKKFAGVLLWDHHPGAGDIDAKWSCVEPVGATITLMVRQMKQRKMVVTPMHATLFLCGLYEDTGSLMFPATRAEDAAAAAWLLDRKADLGIVASFLRPAYGEKQKDVLFQMLKKSKRMRVNGHHISLCRIALSGHVDSLAVVVSMYREIMNSDAAFGIFHSRDKDRCIVIGRSSAEMLDIRSIMQAIGGGGHPGAGSALLKGARPAAVESLIVDLLKGNRQSSVQISDIMSFPVLSVAPDLPMAEVALMLRKNGCTGLPVLDDGRLVGVLSRRDFRKIRKESQLKSPVKAFMSRNPVTIAPGNSPHQAARLMVRHDIGRLPVVENDRVIGIVTRSDAMLYFYDQLPD